MRASNYKNNICSFQNWTAPVVRRYSILLYTTTLWPEHRDLYSMNCFHKKSNVVAARNGAAREVVGRETRSVRADANVLGRRGAQQLPRASLFQGERDEHDQDRRAVLCEIVHGPRDRPPSHHHLLFGLHVQVRLRHLLRAFRSLDPGRLGLYYTRCSWSCHSETAERDLLAETGIPGLFFYNFPT